MGEDALLLLGGGRAGRSVSELRRWRDSLAVKEVEGFVEDAGKLTGGPVGAT